MKKQEMIARLKEQQAEEEKGLADAWDKCAQVINGGEITGDAISCLVGTSQALQLWYWDVQQTKKKIKILEEIEGGGGARK